MASTARSTLATSRKAVFVLAIAAMANAQAPAPVSQGCYTSVTPLKNEGTAIIQSSAACGTTCTGFAVFAMSKGNVCWCGNTLPASSAKTSDSACSSPCTGYPDESCGGPDAYTVWLSGTDDSPPVYGGGSSGVSSSPAAGTTTTPSASLPSTTATKSRHSVVTSVQQGTTVYVTHSGAASSSATTSPGSGSKSGGGTNVAAIAAGVVVAVVAVIAIAAGIFFWLRHKRRHAAEEEYKRTQVSDFMRGSDKPPNTGYSQMSDSRLDPEAGARRNSEGSIADAGDYSRRILRVANPDRGL